MLLTNRFEPHYDYQKIDNDFDIYIVTKESEKLYTTNILDIPTADFKARAVQYFWGAKALVLFDKGTIKESEFRATIQDSYPDATVRKMDILNQSMREEVFYRKDYLLANLLINSLKSPKSKRFSYHNLTGKLYYRDPSWRKKNYIWFLQINFECGMLLNLSVQTFRKKSEKENAPCYVFDEATGAFRKKLKDDDYGELYIKRSYPTGHNTVDFIGYRDFKSFCKSKMGVMGQFLRDIKERLSDYMTLEQCEVKDSTAFKPSKKQDWHQALKSLLKDRSINIDDCCHSSASESLIAEIAHLFGEQYQTEVQIGSLQKEMLNLRIIHNAEYYDDHPAEHDSHKDDVSGYIVQHVTIEDFFKEETIGLHAFDKILQELLIKSDNQKKQMTAFDWSKLGLDHDFFFVKAEKCKDNDKKKDYCMMRVNPDGSFEYEVFCSADEDLSEEQETVKNKYELFSKELFRCGSEIECLLFDSPDNVIAIGKTKEFTCPNTHALYDALYQTQPSTLVRKSDLLMYLDEFAEAKPDYAWTVTEMKEQLNDVENTLTKRDIHRMMNLKNSAYKELNRWLHTEHDLWIYSELKSADSGMELGNLSGIRYYPSEYYGQDLYYYVGSKTTAKDKVSRGCPIRQVRAESELPSPDLLFSMMAVDFVRNGQYTVVPFPIKYLREHFK